MKNFSCFKKIYLFIFSCFFFLFFFSLILSKSIEANIYTFEENFNGQFEETEHWVIYENNENNGGGHVSFLNNNLVKLSSTGLAFPFLHTQGEIFPQDDFKISFYFRYNYVGDHGNGISITDHVPTNGTSPTRNDAIFAFWQDSSNNKWHINATVCPEENPNCGPEIQAFKTTTIDTQYHLIGVTYENEQYKIYRDGNLIFTSIPTPRKPSAIWLGNSHRAGSLGNWSWSSFEVDYFYIESLNQPSPSPSPFPSPSPSPLPSPSPSSSPSPSPDPWLDVVHFSQRDPEWADEEYDDSSTNGNPVGSQEIEDWGCAMTSSAMILDYHGFDRGPDDQETNPSTLNQYLIDNDGYTKNGGLIWSYVTKYAHDAKENEHVDSSLSSLEFNYSLYDLDLLRTDLEATNPGIINVVQNNMDTDAWLDDTLHFVVAKGKEEDTVYLNDPWDLTDVAEEDATLADKYPSKEYRQLARFTKSKTDLSYIWLYSYSPAVDVVVEHNGSSEIPNSQYYEEGSTANVNEPNQGFGDSPGAKVFMLPKPEGGNYRIIFSGPAGGLVDVELHLFDQEADVKRFELQSQLNTQGELVYILNYPSENFENNEPVLEEISFDSLIEKIKALYRSGDIKHRFLKNALLKLTQKAKLYSKKPYWWGRKIAKRLLRLELKIVKRQKGKLITEHGAMVLQQIIEELIESLN